MGSNGKWYPRVISHKRLFEEALRCCGRQHFDKEAFRAISIHVIPPRDPSNLRDLGLVAVTLRGYRVYFNSDYKTDELVPRPTGITPTHIRFTPIDDGNSNDSSLALVQFDCAYYSKGFFFAAGGSGGGVNNTQLCCSIDFGSLAKKKQFVEFVNISHGPERVWAAADVPTKLSTRTLMNYNDLANEVVSMPAQHYILTNQAIYTVYRTRPIDHFVSLLIQSNGRDTDGLYSFFLK